MEVQCRPSIKTRWITVLILAYVDHSPYSFPPNYDKKTNGSVSVGSGTTRILCHSPSLSDVLKPWVVILRLKKGEWTSVWALCGVFWAIWETLFFSVSAKEGIEQKLMLIDYNLKINSKKMFAWACNHSWCCLFIPLIIIGLEIL